MNAEARGSLPRNRLLRANVGWLNLFYVFFFRESSLTGVSIYGTRSFLICCFNVQHFSSTLSAACVWADGSRMYHCVGVGVVESVSFCGSNTQLSLGCVCRCGIHRIPRKREKIQFNQDSSNVILVIELLSNPTRKSHCKPTRTLAS